MVLVVVVYVIVSFAFLSFGGGIKLCRKIGGHFIDLSPNFLSLLQSAILCLAFWLLISSSLIWGFSLTFP